MHVCGEVKILVGSSILSSSDGRCPEQPPAGVADEFDTVRLTVGNYTASESAVARSPSLGLLVSRSVMVILCPLAHHPQHASILSAVT